jgi:hypothetical protein
VDDAAGALNPAEPTGVDNTAPATEPTGVDTTGVENDDADNEESIDDANEDDNEESNDDAPTGLETFVKPSLMMK